MPVSVPGCQCACAWGGCPCCSADAAAPRRAPVPGLPLLNKTLYKREQTLAEMRDAKYGDPQDAKAAARSSRMSLRRGGDALE